METAKFSLFFDSKIEKPIDFLCYLDCQLRAFLMDSFILFGLKYNLSHDAKIPYIPFRNDDF